ncbi:MAG: FHA domain-containing protein [Clostridiales bacterium]|nr:FHA domain-containing protein [Clostridiales bacterium]
MEVEFKREFHHNYMVLSNLEEEICETYSIKMLKAQTIEGILPLDLRIINNEKSLYYEISGRQLMLSIFDKVELSYSKVKYIMLRIINIIESAYEYLLSVDDFMLAKEYIFLDIEKASPWLSYMPGYNRDIKEQMGDFIEFLMDKVDYKDKEGVLLVYQLYSICKEEGYTFEHLQEVIYKDNGLEKNIDKSVKESSFQVKAVDSIAISVEENLVMKKNIMELPVMMEKIEGEEEVTCYPYRTYILSAISIVVGLLIIFLSSSLKIFYKQYGGRIDFLKMFVLIVMVVSIEGYLMKSLWDKKNLITKIVTNNQYVDPRISHYNIIDDEEKQEKVLLPPKRNEQVDYGQKRNIKKEDSEEYNPTCLVENFSTDNNYSYGLIPIDTDEYSRIKIKEFPFFVGKGIENVDYSLENEVISRYHAKILREEERFFLIDLNSTNGSFINGEKLLAYKMSPLDVGDEIALANIRFKFALI